jgi:glycolate oxidase FAD binding subunit
VKGLITAELLSELRAILPEERVKEGERNHPLGNCGKFHVIPQSEEEIIAILQFATKNSKTVNIEGGGTKRGYGGLIESADILLSLLKHKGIVEHVPGDMTLTVRSGTTFKELNDYLAKYSQIIPFDTFLPESATIGGIIAANDNGPKRLGYGSPRDAVIGLRVIYPDGKVIRTGGKVVKNVAGYDMNKLFIGSMGTLGVISEVTLKLRPMPKEESLLLIQGTLEEIKTFSSKLLDSMLEPVTIELLSPVLSEKLTGQYSYTLAIGLEDVETSVRFQENFVRKMMTDLSCLQILTKREAQSFWDLIYSRKQIASTNTEATSLKIGVANMDVIKVIEQIHHLSNSCDMKVEAHGGLGHGLCQVSLAGDKVSIVSSIKQIREIIARLGGYVVVKHLTVALRQEVDVWGEKPSHFFLLEAIKLKIDPKRILNPKRFIGGI